MGLGLQRLILGLRKEGLRPEANARGAFLRGWRGRQVGLWYSSIGWGHPRILKPYVTGAGETLG
jgi:hypothetical protein